MPTRTLPGLSSPNGRAASTVPAPRRSPALGRRRQVPWMVAGVVLIVGCALGFATVQLRLSGDQRVLVASRALPAGHVLAAADLRVARLHTSDAIASLPATAQSRLLGQQLAAPVSAGAMVTADEVGGGHGLTAGADLVAVALKPGQFPPSVTPGDRVLIIDTGASSPSGAAAAASEAESVPATVTALDASSTSPDGTTVVSVQVSGAAAAGVARLAAAGRAALVLTAAGSGS